MFREGGGSPPVVVAGGFEIVQIGGPFAGEEFPGDPRAAFREESAMEELPNGGAFLGDSGEGADLPQVVLGDFDGDLNRVSLAVNRRKSETESSFLQRITGFPLSSDLKSGGEVERFGLSPAMEGFDIGGWRKVSREVDLGRECDRESLAREIDPPSTTLLATTLFRKSLLKNLPPRRPPGGAHHRSER